jgi:ribosomal protein S14
MTLIIYIMSKYYLHVKDLKSKKLFQKKELFRLRMKCLQSHYYLSFSSQCLIYKKFLKSYYNNFSYTKIVHKCMFTFSSRSFFRLFKLSRGPLRSLVLNGSIIGVRKSSW